MRKQGFNVRGWCHGIRGNIGETGRIRLALQRLAARYLVLTVQSGFSNDDRMPMITTRIVRVFSGGISLALAAACAPRAITAPTPVPAPTPAPVPVAAAPRVVEKAPLPEPNAALPPAPFVSGPLAI